MPIDIRGSLDMLLDSFSVEDWLLIAIVIVVVLICKHLTARRG